MTYFIYKTLAMVGTCCMGLLFLGGTALALTPDGQTPAVEQYCNDNFTGKARGLCNAYCEATDCDLRYSGGYPDASDTACDKLEEKFRTAAGDAGSTESPEDLKNCRVGCPCETLWNSGSDGVPPLSSLSPTAFTPPTGLCVDNRDLEEVANMSGQTGTPVFTSNYSLFNDFDPDTGDFFKAACVKSTPDTLGGADLSGQITPGQYNACAAVLNPHGCDPELATE